MQNENLVIDGKEYDLPEGVEALTDDGLYWIDFKLIELAPEYKVEDDKEKEIIKFFNPRHLGSYELEIDGKVEKYHGQGFDKDSMNDLLDNLINKGADYPLLGSWVVRDGKVVGMQVSDGERRHRCFERMIGKNMSVYSQAKKQFLPAKEVYARILCRIKVMTDEEMLQEACEVSTTAVPWGAAALARFIKLLYDKGRSDEQICRLLHKKPGWVADTYSLNELDSLTFDYLLSNKINRSVALRLLKIEDVEKRQELLKSAWQEAVKRSDSTKKKVEESLEKAEESQEVAESRVTELELKGAEPDVLVDAEVDVEEAKKKVKQKQETLAASARAIMKNKDVDRASAKKGNKPRRCLRPPKIQKQLEQIQELIEKDDESVCTVPILRTISHCYKGILDGEQDILKILKKI